jgi:hypothetical protein
MTPAPSPLNPSQAVERIREIIVGRHLERLEQRVERLESGGQGGLMPPQLEDRLCTNEARLEALQQSLQRITDRTREEHESRNRLHREEIQQLASQIQQVAALKAAESTTPAVQQLEGRIGSWLTHWQESLQTHLNDREQRLAGELRQEVATLWENTESQITRIQSRSVTRDAMEERFSRIAAAARALADCAAGTADPPACPTP